jgi:hypothetical protein
MLLRPRTAQVRHRQNPKTRARNPKPRIKNRKPRPRKSLLQLNPNLHPALPRARPDATRRLRAGAVFLSHLLASSTPSSAVILSLLFAYGPPLPFPDRRGFRSILLYNSECRLLKRPQRQDARSSMSGDVRLSTLKRVGRTQRSI